MQPSSFEQPTPKPELGLDLGLAEASFSLPNRGEQKIFNVTLTEPTENYSVIKGVSEADEEVVIEVASDEMNLDILKITIDGVTAYEVPKH